MGVATQLGVGAGLESEVLADAGKRWSGWVERDPLLARVGGLAALPDWLQKVDAGDADAVLHGLVRLGSPSGDDQPAAAGVVAWALLPGACRLAHRLRGVSPRIDDLVAAQVWVEVRSFPWQRLRKVAANVLANTRTAVLQECGATARVRSMDQTWARTVPVDFASPVWGQHLQAEPVVSVDPAVELGVLLEHASASGVLDQRDRLILDRLVVHAPTAASLCTGRGRCGLLADGLVALVAADVGMSPATVRRRARRSFVTLAAAHRTRLAAA